MSGTSKHRMLLFPFLAALLANRLRIQNKADLWPTAARLQISEGLTLATGVACLLGDNRPKRS